MFNFFRRRTIRKAFEKYLSPEMARQIADAPANPTGPAHTERNIDVALIAIAAPDAATYSERAGVVADLSATHLGIAFELLPIVVVSFGCIGETPSGAIHPFILSVRAKIPEASIVHGNIMASVGTFGGHQRMAFGFWWPGYLAALRQLTALAPGEVQELADPV